MNSADSPLWLTVDEFSTLSGLSKATIRRRIADGSLPVLQPGGKRTAVRISRTALEPSGNAVATVSPTSVPPSIPPKQTVHRQPRWRRAL